MAHGAYAMAINEAVRAIIMAKPLDTLTRHPNTENVDQLEEKMANFAPPYVPQIGAAAMADSPSP